MWRYLVGAVAALLLAGGGMLLWRGNGPAVSGNAALAQGTAGVGMVSDDAMPLPPTASDKTREEKRFARYDKDKDGAVAREEYLAPRRKAFARLDTDGDGRLSFDEWALKTTSKFSGADTNGDGRLTPEEFATTRVPRRARPAVKCPPVATHADDEES